jgi:hypothetical protein
MRVVKAFAAAVAVLAAWPAAAADGTVSARQPQGLADALKGAGYEATITADDVGEPVIDLVMQGYKARVLFLDCEPSTRDRCGSIQFAASFDADGPGLTPADAVAFAARYRYAAVTLNGTGDPTLRWDVETGAGLPSEVFVDSAARFLGTVRAMGEMLFPKPTA